MKRIFISILSAFTLSYSSPLDTINSIRTHAGAGVLKKSSILSLAAKKHAIYLYSHGSYSHYESKGAKNYFASTPWYRIAKAGYATKAVGEDISFYEPNFNASIKKLMGTVYHRISLLDLRFDTIGYASYHKIYVYDLSNSYLAKMCKRSFATNGDYVTDICAGGDKRVSSYELNRATTIVEKRSKLLVRYPYPNQKNVALKLVQENPQFIYGNNYGLAVTATFNKAKYKTLDLLSFKLLKNGAEVMTEFVTKRNDIQEKIDENSFVLVPMSPLKRASTYKVELNVLLNGKAKNFVWKFRTRP